MTLMYKFYTNNNRTIIRSQRLNATKMKMYVLYDFLKGQNVLKKQDICILNNYLFFILEKNSTIQRIKNKR